MYMRIEVLLNRSILNKTWNFHVGSPDMRGAWAVSLRFSRYDVNLHHPRVIMGCLFPKSDVYMSRNKQLPYRAKRAQGGQRALTASNRYPVPQKSVLKKLVPYRAIGH